MARVVLKNVRGAQLERGLDLAVADREFVVLTGAGAREGSAIVRFIAGLAEVVEGEILFDDRRVNDLAAKDRDVAFLSHDYEPYPRLSVYENLAIGLKRRQFADAEIKKRIASVTEALGIQNRLEASAGSLLAAERPLVGLARAMARQPGVYLFDQPFANLGPLEASRGRAAVAALQQRSSSTIIYATGDPSEALAFGARTLVTGGSVQQDAVAQTIYDSPANLAVAKFFWEPPMNLVQGTLKREREGLIFVETGEGTLSVNLPARRFDPAAMDLVGKAVVLGFRPESIEILPSEGSQRPAIGFRALVERAEPKGAGTDLYLRTGAHELICRTARWDEGGGRRLQFTIDLEKASLFDGETGVRATAD